MNGKLLKAGVIEEYIFSFLQVVECFFFFFSILSSFHRDLPPVIIYYTHIISNIHGQHY